MTILLRLPAVLDRTALSRSRVYDLLERGDFPRPVKLSGRINAWPSDEIDAWIQSRIADREAA